MKKFIFEKRTTSQNKVFNAYNELILQEIKFNSDTSMRDKFVKNFKLFLKDMVSVDDQTDEHTHNGLFNSYNTDMDG